MTALDSHQLALAHLAATLLLVRAEEAWQPVLLGGLIPMVGALAVFFLIWYAVRQKPEDEEDGDERPRGGG